ncbi:hypothetical protein D7X48_07090 [bacterium D16-50]|nr:hypothetical protein D7X48_07090 [bacterium D16-50]
MGDGDRDTYPGRRLFGREDIAGAAGNGAEGSSRPRIAVSWKVCAGCAHYRSGYRMSVSGWRHPFL